MSEYIYINQDYMVLNTQNFGPILEFRNGQKDKEVIDRILKMCSMKVKSKRKDFYILEEAND